MKAHRFALIALSNLLLGMPALAAATVAAAPAEPAPYSDTVLGDLGGMRSKLADKGVEVELGYTGDGWGVTSGGKKRIATYQDRIDARVNLDGEKLFGLHGNKVSVALMDNNGTTTNASTVGSTQGIDNNEVATGGVRLYEAWMEQNFLDERLSVLVGLHDLKSEFAVTDISANFIKPTMQIGQSFAQSGRNGPSIYPTTSLAGRVRVKPTANSYVAVAAYDGVPGEPDRTSGSRVDFAKKDGLLLVGEVGIAPKVEGSDAELNKLALGLWHYTGALDDVNDPTKKNTPQGAYLLASRQFYHDKAGRSAGVFLRGGVADGDTAQVDFDYEAGLVGTGWLPSRPDGEFGLGISQAHNGDKYRKAQAAAATPSDRNEYSYELYYRDTLTRGVTLQPDLQYVVNPGTDKVTENAFILGARLAVSF